jgi:hypothetical protein
MYKIIINKIAKVGSHKDKKGKWGLINGGDINIILIL